MILAAAARSRAILTGSTTSADPVVEFPVGYRWITLTGEGSDGGITTRRYLVVVLDPDDPDVILFDKKDLRRTADGQTLTDARSSSGLRSIRQSAMACGARGPNR